MQKTVKCHAKANHLTMNSKISMLNQMKIAIGKNMTHMLEPETLFPKMSAGVEVTDTQSTIFFSRDAHHHWQYMAAHPPFPPKTKGKKLSPHCYYS